MTTQQ